MLAGGIATLAFAVTMLVGAPAGHTDSAVDRAARALATDPLYIDPAADSPLTARERSALRALLAGARTPVNLAVLPASAADGDIDGLPSRVYRAGGERPGTYAVLIGDYLAASSSEIGAQAGDLAESATAGHEDVVAAVTEFVHAVEDAAEPEPPMYYDKEGPGGKPQYPAAADEPSRGGVLGLVAVVAIIGFLARLAIRASGRGGGRGAG